MGQIFTRAPKVEPPSPESQAEVHSSRRREVYLKRLGISRDSCSRAPTRSCTLSLVADGVLSSEIREDDGPGQRSVTRESSSTTASDEHEDDRQSRQTPSSRTKEDFRVNFLRKLSYEKVWVPQVRRPPKHQTVVIFDWDDTFIPSTFLRDYSDQGAGLPPLVERHLRDIATTVANILSLAQRLGHTFIITNASAGWVEYSAAKWVPSLLTELKKVPIISARTRYEQDFPQEVAQWKTQAFLEVQKKLDSTVITNLISMGDSNFELDAVHTMGKEFEQVLVKTIKLRHNPSPEELLKQLELVVQKFDRIVLNAKSLKIGLERKWVQPTE